MLVNDNARLGLWAGEHGGGFYRAGTQCIGWEKDGEIKAVVMYDWFNGASIYMHVAAQGLNWLTREYLHACFHYPFEQLKVNLIIGLVGSNNRKAIRFDEHLGFTLEHRIARAHPDGDLLIYTMTKEQCRYVQT